MLDLLELIPDHTMSTEQKALKPANRDIFNGGFLPMYKFRREPSHVEDFDWEITTAAGLYIGESPFGATIEPSLAYAAIIAHNLRENMLYVPSIVSINVNWNARFMAKPMLPLQRRRHFSGR